MDTVIEHKCPVPILCHFHLENISYFQKNTK